MSEEQNPFWMVGRAFLGTSEKVTITKNPDAPILSALPSPSEAIEAAHKQARAELRDRFAMAALTGMMASRDPNSPRFHPEDDAAYVYAVADAMMKARGDV